MNNEEMRKMWEAAIKEGLSPRESPRESSRESPRESPRTEFTPHETHISRIQTGAKTQGRALTADENAEIARHRQNAWDAARRSKPEPK